MAGVPALDLDLTGDNKATTIAVRLTLGGWLSVNGVTAGMPVSEFFARGGIGTWLRARLSES
jgi:hypothetical protein